MLERYHNTKVVAGTDEAGRGCLAGPVTAAAVILPEDFQHNLLNDSKKTKVSTRDILRRFIEDKCASFGVSHVFMEEIEELNILNASILAMHRAIDQLDCEPEFIVVDGNKFKPYRSIDHACIIKGDGKYLSIAAASILAKTYRDAYMATIHEEFPMYNWKKNKGYPTTEHREAILKYGISKYHRRSFRLLPEQLKLEI